MNAYEKKLIRLYLKTETAIINEIARLRSLGLADYHVVAALRRVQTILASMQSEAWEYTPKMVEQFFYAEHPEKRVMVTSICDNMFPFALTGTNVVLVWSRHLEFPKSWGKLFITISAPYSRFRYVSLSFWNSPPPRIPYIPHPNVVRIVVRLVADCVVQPMPEWMSRAPVTPQ